MKDDLHHSMLTDRSSHEFFYGRPPNVDWIRGSTWFMFIVFVAGHPILSTQLHISDTISYICLINILLCHFDMLWLYISPFFTAILYIHIIYIVYMLHLLIHVHMHIHSRCTSFQPSKPSRGNQVEGFKPDQPEAGGFLHMKQMGK